MHLRCPQCRAELTIADSQQSESTSCPSCGSQFNVGEITVSVRPQEHQTVGHFDLIAPVGQGQFGVVWRAWDRKLNRQVAIKIPRWAELSGRDRDGFLREAEAAAALEHPNIVRVYEVANNEDHHYIVSQFIHGVTLDAALTNHDFTWQQKAELLAKVADAVHFAHEKHVIHRDLKPKNILVDSKNEPFVADFGLAKQEASEFTLTAEGAVLGTPAYMSPEQARGESRLTDRRSDVFSLGVILYEMLSGTRPFVGPNMAALMWQIESTNPTSPRSHRTEVPRDLETICLKALEKVPAKRYQTAAEFGSDLRRYIEGRPILARRATVIDRLWRWTRRNRLAASLIVVSLASATTAGSMVLQQQKRPTPQYLVQAAPESKAVAHQVLFQTTPEGASLTLYPRNKQTGAPILESKISPTQVTPCSVQLSPGEYLIVAVLPDNRFHEVYRTVPNFPGEFTNYLPHCSHEKTDGGVKVPVINIPSLNCMEGMVYIQGDPQFQAGIADSKFVPLHSQSISNFYLAPHEVTIEEFRKNWPERYRMRTSLQKTSPPDDFPITLILADEAIAYAERIGCRLPTEYEYEYAATNGGRTNYPWGDEPQSVSHEISSVTEPTTDLTKNTPPLRGLYSNAEELTESFYTTTMSMASSLPSALPTPSAYVTVRDCDPAQFDTKEALRLGVKYRRGTERVTGTTPKIGFRTARSELPRN